MKAVKLFKVSEPIEDILSRPSGKLVGLLGFFGSLIIIPLLLLIILLGVVGIFIGSRGGYSVIDRVESPDHLHQAIVYRIPDSDYHVGVDQVGVGASFSVPPERDLCSLSHMPTIAWLNDHTVLVVVRQDAMWDVKKAAPLADGTVIECDVKSP